MIPFVADLAYLGVPTINRRRIDALRIRRLPQPIISSFDHDEAVTVGLIDTVEVEGSVMRAYGEIEAEYVGRYLCLEGTNGTMTFDAPLLVERFTVSGVVALAGEDGSAVWEEQAPITPTKATMAP